MNRLIDLNLKTFESLLFLVNERVNMYKLTVEIREGCELSFTPEKSNEVRKIFMDDTCWYPQRIEGKGFVSLNISSADTLKEFFPSASLQGNIFGAFPINDNDVCYVYSGSLRSNRISAFLGLRPLCTRGERLYYFFTDEDFKNICQDVKTYAKKVIENSGDTMSLTDEDLNVLNKIEKTPLTNIATNLEHYRKFFEIYCNENCVKADLTPEDPCEYCTAKVGLHPLLHIVKLVPSDTWIEGYCKDFLIYLLHQDFLVDWIDIKNLNETRQKTILSEAKEIVPAIKDVKDFKEVVEKTIRNMINRRDIFKILYYLSRYEDIRFTSLKAMFDNLFYLLPKKAKEYLFYPKFQPKLFVDGFEMHFIMMAKHEEDIVRMDKDLQGIFDETEYSKTVPSNVSTWLYRYRFSCKLKLGGHYVDYIDLPDVIEDTCNAIRALANRNGVEFVPGEPGLSESWLKRMSIKIVTPPQFEYAIFKAFAFLPRWHLRRKVSEDVERVYLFSVVGYEKDLDKGVVPEVLKNKFKTKGFSLSKNATVEKGADIEWRITDNENIFVVRKEEEKERLNIYAMLKCKIISTDVRCEYPGLVSQQARFDYLRDMQSFYDNLNGLLEKEFNFKMFG